MPCRCLPNFEHKFADWEQSGSDQWDWSKLWGVSFHWFTNHKNSAMVGIRYNPRTERVELVPYYHVDGSSGIYPPAPLAKVKLDETFYTQITIDYHSKTYKLSIQTQTQIFHSIPQPFSHQRKWTRGINFWFGGNRTAPKTVQVSLTPIKDLPPINNSSKNETRNVTRYRNGEGIPLGGGQFFVTGLGLVYGRRPGAP